MIIKTTFNIIGAAEAAANLLCEFKIAEKKDAKLIDNIKGNVILVSSVAKINFSGSDLKPGAISETNKGINNSMRITSPSNEKVNKLKTLFAKFSESGNLYWGRKSKYLVKVYPLSVMEIFLLPIDE